MALQANYGLPTPELETLLRLDQEVSFAATYSGGGGGLRRPKSDGEKRQMHRRQNEMVERPSISNVLTPPPPNDISAIVSVLADVEGKLKRTDLCPTDLCLTDLCPTLQQPEKTKR